MKLLEMEGFLRGKCLPGDLKVNETNTEYLVRKLNELESKLEESRREFRSADITMQNLEAQLKQSKIDADCYKKGMEASNARLVQLAAENAGLIRSSEILLHEASEVYRAYNKTQLPDGDLVDEQSLQEVYDAINATPTTDTFLAEVRASAIKSALDDCSEYLDRDCIMESNGISYDDAALREIGAMALQEALLRKGAAQ
ncbi:TPA: hypothetical protein ACXE9L_000801 [Citrobacter koseri]